MATVTLTFTDTGEDSITTNVESDPPLPENIESDDDLTFAQLAGAIAMSSVQEVLSGGSANDEDMEDDDGGNAA